MTTTVGQIDETTSAKGMRSCIACGTRRPKADLLRIVRTDGEVQFDRTGKMPGRGAYVCSCACFEKVANKQALNRALRTKIDSETYQRIATDVQVYISDEA